MSPATGDWRWQHPTPVLIPFQKFARQFVAYGQGFGPGHGDALGRELPLAWRTFHQRLTKMAGRLKTLLDYYEE